MGPPKPIRVVVGPGLPGASVRRPAAGVVRRRRGAGPRLAKVLLAGAAALSLCIGSSSWGQAQQEAAPPSVWTYSFYKTITYELFAGLADLSLYYTVLGGTGAAGGILFGAVNLLTSGAVYYAYEVSWNLYGPSIRDLPPSEALEVEINKTLLYRVVDAAGHFVVAYAFTGTAAASVGFALASIVIDGAIYAANEYGWYAYGPAVASGESASLPQTASEAGFWPAAEDAYRVSAIAIGAVAGVIVANVVTGGMATSVLAAGTPTAALAAAETGAAYLGGLATTAIGAVGGAYAADWLFQQ